MVYKKLPTIKTEPYNYSIEGQKDEYYLYVQCNNSAGMYEIRKKLNKAELEILLSNEKN
jgi:hypothetical protein